MRLKWEECPAHSLIFVMSFRHTFRSFTQPSLTFQTTGLPTLSPLLDNSLVVLDVIESKHLDTFKGRPTPETDLFQQRANAIYIIKRPAKGINIE